MSLDVYLYGPEEAITCECSECGNQHSTTRRETLYYANITHNLNGMADEAGIYYALWRPGEMLDPEASSRIKCEMAAGRSANAYAIEELLPTPLAAHLIEPLRAGLELLRSDRARFEKLNPPNGWGTYDGLVNFVERYLAACEEHPTATVRVSR